MMNRRRFLQAVGASVLAAPVIVEAQQVAMVHRIGYLELNRADALSSAFREELRSLGYVEGRNVVIEYRSAEGKPERLSALAAELVALKVEVMLAGAGTLPAFAAQQATKTVPIVFTSAGDPVASGLVTALRGRAATSRGCPFSSRSWSASVWNT